MPTGKTESKSAYLSISKAKAKQFQKQPKKIQESDEKLQEEDKEYLIKQNVDHHSDALSNKTIEKSVDKHSTKYAGDNLDKSDEFIFVDSEEKIETKKIKNSKVDAENPRESEAISNNILERMKVREVYTDSQCSEEDEENFVLSTSIFDIFDEVKIKGEGNWLLRSLSHCAFGQVIAMILSEKWFATTFKFIEIDLQNL